MQNRIQTKLEEALVEKIQAHDEYSASILVDLVYRDHSSSLSRTTDDEKSFL
jgi:hypothetical protein